MEKVRPNIRIEIHNNITEDEPMEVTENLNSDNEEGEIVDDENLENIVFSNKSPPEVENRIWPNTKGIFTTGINIFDKQEQEKLQERAKRFALKPEEIHSFTDADLGELHESLGITIDNEHNVRFEAVHMIGTKEMSTEDVLEYFAEYAPTGIEWIDDDSCNVIWLENISAARAIFHISKIVKGMPARGPCDPFAKEFIDDLEEADAEATGQSILLKNTNREVELKVDNEILPNKINYKNAVDLSEIMIPIPPGYWRLGKKHSKAKSLLLRFSFKTDKKPYKAEKFSKYYKKYGNPNYGGLKGVISESKKKEIRGIFARNKDLNHEKNPWGMLAKNWDHDAKFREREPEIEPKLEVKNPSILVRLGAKRKANEEEIEKELEVNEEDEDTNTTERKKNKLPRMRMYADEEEEKMRRKRLLQTIKRQAEKLSKDDRSDLRNVLGITNTKSSIEDIIEVEPEVEDLGMKLKNRTKNMVFTVERDHVETYDRKENVRSDIRSLIEERRARSPVARRRISPPQWSLDTRHSSDYRRRSPRRHRSPLRRSMTRRRKSPERTLHSDRMYPRYRHRRHRNSEYYSEEETNNLKPKSKVAVVIKTQKKPTVASTIWSRVQRESESSSESESSWSEESSSSSSSSSSSEESESETDEEPPSSRNVKKVHRPGFRSAHRRLEEVDHRSPLKITMTNDRFKKEPK